MDKKNIVKMFIMIIVTLVINFITYLLNNKIGIHNNYIIYIIISIYSLLAMYNLFFGNIRVFNKIYMFGIGILSSFRVFKMDYTPRIPKDSLKQVRTMDIYNSKIIYLIGNITILLLLYFVYTCIFGQTPSFIYLILFVLGLVFPVFYVLLNESLTLNFSKKDLIKLILMIILIIITGIIIFYFRINWIIVLVYFSLLLSLILSFDNKKLFIVNLILLLIFITVPLFIIMWLF